MEESFPNVMEFKEYHKELWIWCFSKKILKLFFAEIETKLCREMDCSRRTNFTFIKAIEPAQKVEAVSACVCSHSINTLLDQLHNLGRHLHTVFINIAAFSRPCSGWLIKQTPTLEVFSC